MLLRAKGKKNISRSVTKTNNVTRTCEIHKKHNKRNPIIAYGQKGKKAVSS